MQCIDMASYVCRPLWSSGLFPLQIIGQSIRDKVKIIHIQFEFVTFGSFYTSLFIVPFLLLLKLLHLKTVITLHGPIFPRNAPSDMINLLRPANTKVPLTIIKLYIISTYVLMSKLSSAIIVHGQCFKKWLSAYGIKNCHVIPHGMMESKEVCTTLSSGMRVASRNILFFGVLSPRKGLEYLLQAFAEVLKEKNDITLIIAGDEPPYYRGYKKKLVSMAYDFGIKNKVVFTGYLNDDRVDELFRQADIVVLPYPYSVSASGPLSLAVQYGKPVIATATEFFSEELDNGKTALLVQERNSEDLAKAIKVLIADESLRRRLAENIRLIAREKSWKKVAQETFELYQSLF